MRIDGETTLSAVGSAYAHNDPAYERNLVTNFANSLKAEVSRLARKELKTEVAALRKTTSAHRSEIAALKREVKSLLAEVKRLSTQRSPRPTRSAESSEDNRPKRGRRAKYSAEMLAALRKRWGLTQAQMGQVIGVSSLSIYKWESGQVTPRQSQQDKVLALRNVGKRAAAKLLEAA